MINKADGSRKTVSKLGSSQQTGISTSSGGKNTFRKTSLFGMLKYGFCTCRVRVKNNVTDDNPSQDDNARENPAVENNE